MGINHNHINVALLLTFTLLDIAAIAYMSSSPLYPLAPLFYIPLGIIVLMLLKNTGSMAKRIVVEYVDSVPGSAFLTKERFDSIMNLATISNDRIFALKGIAVSTQELKSTIVGGLYKNKSLGVDEEIGYLVRRVSCGDMFASKANGIIGSLKNPESFISRCWYESAINGCPTSITTGASSNAILYNGEQGRRIARGIRNGRAKQYIFLPNEESRLRLCSAMLDYSKNGAGLLLLYLTKGIEVVGCFT